MNGLKIGSILNIIIFFIKTEVKMKRFIHKKYSPKLKLDADASVLDLGCGKGRHAFKMSSFFNRSWLGFIGK